VDFVEAAGQEAPAMLTLIGAGSCADAPAVQVQAGQDGGAALQRNMTLGFRGWGSGDMWGSKWRLQLKREGQTKKKGSHSKGRTPCKETGLVCQAIRVGKEDGPEAPDL
jgi:hypothetical protein